jgi:flavin-dependent thymidylate synthase
MERNYDVFVTVILVDNTVEWASTPGYYGGDITHATSAWTSTSRDLSDEKRARIPQMLKMLAENGHHTPFEKSFLHFLVVCDTASHIHLLKHRVGVSINGESARYKELKDDKYYRPIDWPEDLNKELDGLMERTYGAYHEIIDGHEEINITKKRAKESARFLLPYANQVTLDVSFNFRSFMHFQNLRNKPEAQVEIRQIADKMLYLVRDTGAFEHSLNAFGYLALGVTEAL